jgi:ribosome-associated protein
MASDRLIAGPVEIPLREIQITFARSRGPGGQNVNKLETKVVLRWRPRESEALDPDQLARLEEKLGNRLTFDGDLLVTSDRHRRQERNRTDAMERLADLVKRALEVPKPRKPTRPTRASKERRIQDKKRRGETKRRRREPPS